MAKKKQTKKRKKAAPQTKGKPTFEMRQSAPKTFGASGNAGNSKNTSSMRAPGSGRKR